MVSWCNKCEIYEGINVYVLAFSPSCQMIHAKTENSEAQDLRISLLGFPHREIESISSKYIHSIFSDFTGGEKKFNGLSN